jgi:hypothetical protein
MVAVLALVIPFGLAGAVSPMMLTEQAVLLSGPDGPRTAGRYAAGAALVLLALAGLVVLCGRSVALPRRPHLDASLDLALGAALGAIAWALHRRRRDTSHPSRPRRIVDRRAALAFGAASMATNFTTLAVMVPAAKEIAASHLAAIERLVPLAIFVALASTPAWSPVALTELAPGPAQRLLRAFAALVARRGRQITVVLVAVLGTLLVARGVIRLVTQ